MKILVGEVEMKEVTDQKLVINNKTWEFLLPCLKDYGRIFTNKIFNVFKVAVGIGDIIVENAGFKHEKHLFMLVNTNICTNHFVEFLDWIKMQPMYVDDYVYGNIQKSTLHMFIIKLPERFTNSVSLFKQSKYSEMYEKADIDKFFETHPTVRKILIKDHNYKLTFIHKLNEYWGTSLKAYEWNGELELPINPDEEIFNNHLKK